MIQSRPKIMHNLSNYHRPFNGSSLLHSTEPDAELFNNSVLDLNTSILIQHGAFDCVDGYSKLLELVGGEVVLQLPKSIWFSCGGERFAIKKILDLLFKALDLLTCSANLSERAG